MAKKRTEAEKAFWRKNRRWPSSDELAHDAPAGAPERPPAHDAPARAPARARVEETGHLREFKIANPVVVVPVPSETIKGPTPTAPSTLPAKARPRRGNALYLPRED